MLTQKPAAERASRPAGAPLDTASLTCLFEGRYVPLSEANVSIMTHAFMYGTAVFEGIRAYWNAEQGQLYALRVREHMERIRNSARILLMEDLPSVDQLVGEALEVLRRNAFREDAYVRPSFYKSTQAIGVKLHGLEHRYYILALPFGDYVDTTVGVKIATVSWRRTGDTAIPSRAKIVGSYVNPAFSKSEAMLNGYDEAFFCGTGAQISPIIEVDRRAIGGGTVGPITQRIKDRYFDIVRGKVPEYEHWVTPIYVD
jgi:branched-chain amino acid aminotransferase